LGSKWWITSLWTGKEIITHFISVKKIILIYKKKLKFELIYDDIDIKSNKKRMNKMEIIIFRNAEINALQDEINRFLDRYSDGIDIIQIIQSSSGAELTITILFRVKEGLDGF
jgi:hypothetical protein